MMMTTLSSRSPPDPPVNQLRGKLPFKFFICSIITKFSDAADVTLSLTVNQRVGRVQYQLREAFPVTDCGEHSGEDAIRWHAASTANGRKRHDNEQYQKISEPLRRFLPVLIRRLNEESGRGKNSEDSK